MRKTRIDNFDFIRSIAAWLIVIYHFSCICMYNPNFYNFPFYTHANNVWGENTSVNIFFILSGASLFYNHEKLKLKDLKTYYINRFKGIFPMFYMIWLFCFYQKAAVSGTLFYNGNPKSLLLTLFGMDGYLSYRFPQNYYIIGEWFLGALILLYIAYPLLTWCMAHIEIPTTVFLAAATLSLLKFQPYFRIQIDRNLITCMFAFWLGMVFIKHKEVLSAKWITVVFGLSALFLICVKVPLPAFLCAQLIPIGLFLILYQLGGIILKVPAAKRFFRYSAGISYGIFLTQNVVLSQMTGMFANQALSLQKEIILLLAAFCVIYAFATAATILNKALTAKLFPAVKA